MPVYDEPGNKINQLYRANNNNPRADYINQRKVKDKEEDSTITKSEAQSLVEMMQRIEEKVDKESSYRKARNTRRKDVECYACKMKGHYARECPEKTAQNSLNYQGPALQAKGRSYQS